LDAFYSKTIYVFTDYDCTTDIYFTDWYFIDTGSRKNIQYKVKQLLRLFRTISKVLRSHCIHKPIEGLGETPNSYLWFCFLHFIFEDRPNYESILWKFCVKLRVTSSYNRFRFCNLLIIEFLVRSLVNVHWNLYLLLTGLN
jgi:hypothetical protein